MGEREEKESGEIEPNSILGWQKYGSGAIVRRQRRSGTGFLGRYFYIKVNVDSYRGFVRQTKRQLIFRDIFPDDENNAI